MHFLRSVLAVSAALALVPALAAQSPAPKPTPKAAPKFTPQQERQRADDLRRYDKNKNGKLDPDERKQMMKDRQNAKAFMNAP